MSCDSFQEDFLEYRANRLSPERTQALGEHLRTCLTCQRAWADFQELDRKLASVPTPEPSANLSRNFYAMLDTHLAAQREPGVFAPVRRGFARLWSEWMPVNPFAQAGAAAALVACGVLTTLWMQTRRERDADLAALRQQVDAVTRLVAYTALDRESAPDRVQAMLTTDTANSVGIAKLLSALSLDPNVNVRLSALDSLYAHAGDAAVQSGVLAALTREASPIVQVAMIDFLATARATEAQGQFETLARNPATNSTVRAAATSGLARLL
ncbi:MAG TPA: hypothetical protein VK178_10930 [Opitutaceae bacterium]|nr:hypothetical protein [Opitutaceae bacterium]